MKPITAVEYRKAVEMARENDRGIGGIANMSRVLLALAGAWREVPENLESRDWADQERERIVIINTGKAAIAARNGLPVEGIKE